MTKKEEKKEEIIEIIEEKEPEERICEKKTEEECDFKETRPEEGEVEERFVLKVENKPQGPTFTEKLVEGIKEVAEVSAAVVVVGYEKAETFVKSEEFKQDVEITKKTTEAVAVGLVKGFGKLIEEVKKAVKEVKASEILMEDKPKDE